MIRIFNYVFTYSFRDFMKEVQVKDLFAHAAYVGHRRSKWNPKMKEYIFAEKDGIHVIDLEKTKLGLEKAAMFLKVAFETGKTVLCVGTKPQASLLVKDMAAKLNAPSVTSKWPAGFLTNWDVFALRVKYMKDLRTKRENGELEARYTKKEIVNFDKEIKKLEDMFSGVETMDRLPDVLFVVDPFKEALSIKEAQKKKIPVVAIVDTNGNPDGIDYVIPANDDAHQSLNFILGYLTEACLNSGKPAQKSEVKMMNVAA